MTLTTQQSALAKLNRALLPICCVMIGFCYLDRSNIAYAAISLRKPPPLGMSLDDVTYGKGSGSFFIGYALFQVPSNIILCRVGAPRWLSFIVVLWGILAMVMAGMRGATDFIVIRLLLGIAEAGTFPGLWYHMALFYPNEAITMPISLTKVAVLIAQVLSAPLAAALISMQGIWGLAGWQWLFLLEGLPTVLVGLCLAFFMPASPASVGSLTPAELAWVQQGVVLPPTFPQLIKGLKASLLHARLWWLTVAFAIKSCASYSLMFWCPLIIDDLLGPSRKGTLDAILLTSLPYLCSAAFTYFQGWSSQKLQERRLHTAVPFMASGALLLASPMLEGPRSALLAFVVLCLSMACAHATGPFTAMVSGALPSNQQAAGLALCNSVANVGGYIGPATFGYLKARTGSNGLAMLSLGLCLMAAALMIYLFDDSPASNQIGRRTFTKLETTSESGEERGGLTEQQPLPVDGVRPRQTAAASLGPAAMRGSAVLIE